MVVVDLRRFFVGVPDLSETSGVPSSPGGGDEEDEDEDAADPTTVFVIVERLAGGRNSGLSIDCVTNSMDGLSLGFCDQQALINPTISESQPGGTNGLFPSFTREFMTFSFW